MRPRHMCLGKHLAARLGYRNRSLASMRPRHMCLGKPRRRKWRALHSRRFNEAEAHVPRKTQGVRGGHARIVASFNEAEAHVPRKTRKAGRIASRKPTLQ